MLDKFLDILMALIMTIWLALLILVLALFACFLHKELTHKSQSNHPAKIEVCK